MTNPKIFEEHRKALPGPDDITRVELENGITILTRSNFNSPTLSIKGTIKCGSILDPQAKLGVSYLTAAALMTGTARHDFQTMYNEIESVGARLGFSSGTLTTSFSAHCLSEDLTLILRLISESLRSPTFQQKEFRRLKNQLLTGLTIRAQDTSEMASLLFDGIIYDGHPYQHPEEGYIETVQRIERDDLENFYQQNYGPQGMVFVIVGDVESGLAVDAVKNVFGDWANENQRPVPQIPEQRPIQKTTKKALSIPGKFQADIVIGGLAPERMSPEYHALRIGNNILGEFGMMGRLGKRVREQEGLAYYAYSSLSLGIGPGAWEMIAGVNPENIEKTIALITDEVRKYVSDPVTEQELADSKSYFLGRMPLMLESNSGVAISLLNLERFKLGLDYFMEYPKQVQAVTAQEILHASRKYLDPDRLAIAIAGP
jgi:zinc protease